MVDGPSSRNTFFSLMPRPVLVASAPVFGTFLTTVDQLESSGHDGCITAPLIGPTVSAVILVRVAGEFRQGKATTEPVHPIASRLGAAISDVIGSRLPGQVGLLTPCGCLRIGRRLGAACRWLARSIPAIQLKILYLSRIVRWYAGTRYVTPMRETPQPKGRGP